MAQAPGTAGTPQQQEPHRTTVLENFSFAQVIASALAAVTSALLSQQIGLIGGMLGVAAGAAAATVAIQLYRGILDVSGERLREQITPVANDLTSRIASDHTTGDETEVIPAPHEGAYVPAQRIASDTLIMRRAELERSNRVRATLFAAAFSLLAVALVAVVIHVATAGEGLGERVVIVPAAETSQEQGEDSLDQAESTEEATEEGTDQAAQATDGGATPSEPATGDQATGTETPAGQATDPGAQPGTDASAGDASSADTEGGASSGEASSTGGASQSAGNTTPQQPAQGTTTPEG
ncbi:MAG: hypothetical protein IJG82_06305 [Atopobiaceae bacterium]|nr:hypothetical protein [Atopobiaceae bacterium]